MNTSAPRHEAVAAFVNAANAAIDNPADTGLSNDDLAKALTAAIKLFAARVELAERFPPPLTQQATATDVIVAVTEMIRFADLNMFDVNMWLNRPRPEDQ